MNLEKKMDDRSTARATGEALRSWSEPAVVRLEAGAAEAGTRTVVQDGPLNSYS